MTPTYMESIATKFNLIANAATGCSLWIVVIMGNIHRLRLSLQLLGALVHNGRKDAVRHILLDVYFLTDTNPLPITPSFNLKNSHRDLNLTHSHTSSAVLPKPTETVPKLQRKSPTHLTLRTIKYRLCVFFLKTETSTFWGALMSKSKCSGLPIYMFFWTGSRASSKIINKTTIVNNKRYCSVTF